MNNLLKQKIIFTADIHNMTMKGGDQKLIKDDNITEVKLCYTFLEVMNKYGFKPILFFTGKSILEELDDIKYLMKNYNFYIGGHTYNAYKPKIIFRSFYRLFKTFYPLKFIQDLDIKITKKIFLNKLNVEIIYWRNHAYFHDKNTNDLLKNNGFELVSNIVDLQYYIPKKKNNLVLLPINTFPDHEYLDHSTDHSSNWTLDHWYKANLIQINKILSKKGLATLLTHPLCIYLEDNFNSFDEFVSKVNKMKSKYT